MKHNRKGILNLSMESFSHLRYEYRSQRGRVRTHGEALSNFQRKVHGGDGSGICENFTRVMTRAVPTIHSRYFFLL